MITSGLYTALLTPFKNDTLHEESFKKLLSHQRDAGVDGLVAYGTTGEGASLTSYEKRRILQLCKQECPHLPLIAGTGTNATHTTIEQTKEAADEGAHAALVITPYYNKPMQEGLYQHFMKLADASPIPIVTYNNPGRTAVNMEVATLDRLLSHPNIIGHKESPVLFNTAVQLALMMKEKHPKALLFVGDDLLTPSFMAIGANSLISGSANLLPREMKQIVESCMQRDFAKATETLIKIAPLLTAFGSESFPICIKEAMNLAGYDMGPPRLPLTPATEESRQKLEKALEPILGASV